MFNKALATAPADQEGAYKALGMKMIDDKIILPILSPNSCAGVSQGDQRRAR